jgi:uncharacterized membrane protein YozB (DUF420 family)
MRGVLGRPGFLGTFGTIGSDLSYILALLFTAIFLVAWSMASRHQGNRHHRLILWAMVAMLSYFSFYYLTRRLGVLAIEGKEGFGGPGWFYNYIFSPVLVAHLLLVSIGLVMGVYMIILGFRASFMDGGRRFLKGDELKIKKKNYYIILSAALAVLMLAALLRCSTLRCAAVYGATLMLVALVFFLEKLIERVLPYGAQRHRLMGRFTMVIYIMVLFTSSLVYLFLYILYPPQLPGV